MNSVQLTGRLTKDLDLKRLDNNTAVINFIIAVDKEISKEKKEQYMNEGKKTAEFIPVAVFGRPAENCACYLAKGSKVAISGKLTTGSYVATSGETRFTMHVIADRVEFIGTKKQKEQQSPIIFDDDDDYCFLDYYDEYDEYEELTY